MKLLDERGIGTVWSICKEKFALVGHTHNYAGSGSPGGSANSAIGVVDYNQTGKTIQIGYSGTGITGDQIKCIAGYTNGSGNVNAKIKDVSKDALKSWLGLGSLAYSSSSIPTKLSQLNNDKGFVTGSVSGNTVTINGASTTWTNTWRGIQDNLTSSSTSESLSANQGKVLKGLIDSKANSSDLSSYAQKNEAVKDVDIIKIIQGQIGVQYQYIKVTNANGENKLLEMHNASNNMDGFMSLVDKAKLDGIEQGANYYTLPVASHTTLGGIKTSCGYTPGNSWPIYVDLNNKIYTRISGLNPVGSGITGIESIDIAGKGTDHTTNYSAKEIIIDSMESNKKPIKFPSKAGTFALLSDIPDVSNLCRFNFVNSISECRNDRINFFLRCSDTLIDLEPFDTYPDGTILIITTTENSTPIKHHSGIWYSCGDKMNISESYYTYKDQIDLITKNNGTVHHYKF